MASQILLKSPRQNWPKLWPKLIRRIRKPREIPRFEYPQGESKNPQNPTGKEGRAASGGTNSGTIDGEAARSRQPLPPELLKIIEAWASLPQAIRDAMVTMAEAGRR